MKYEVKRNQETRRYFRARIEKANTENHATSNNKLQRHNRQASGRPWKNAGQRKLLSTIINIVQASSATDDRRRTETTQLDNFG